MNRGVVADTEVEGSPTPPIPRAVTLKSYLVSNDKLVTVQPSGFLVGSAAQLLLVPPCSAVTVYTLTGTPPVLAGAVKVTDAVLRAIVTATFVGLPGATAALAGDAKLRKRPLTSAITEAIANGRRSPVFERAGVVIWWSPVR
ncbi:unannotated protein [freshwater metagenome]|uniref:Unannotated protein n=1 Tax=freshwater metagenome TaxID=449393 RepID=A0A6J7KKJ6_9ZZZZ